MEYNYRDIEKKWQKNWKDSGIYKVKNKSEKPKYYVLDMFPYPSGAGLHVGHPLGYIASDIYARYKRLKGFNVLHPMGFDSFGLPAEQYAIETGQHPAATTEKNIETFKSQLDKIGFCYDWSREVRTSDPNFYRWTQWIFLQLFKSWYNHKNEKAEPIETLIALFESSGTQSLQGSHSFNATEWKSFDEKKRQEILMDFRLAFSSYGEVNWCEALGTVLANDEVVNGVSERGGHPVEKKKMRQWYLRITEYADRLLQGLETVNFSDAMKEMQRNWIGRSEGAEMKFSILDSQSSVDVYTTRPDTIFGVDFLVLAPEHALVKSITTEAQRSYIDEYLTYVKSRSDRERQAEVKQITGCFTGSYAINPFNGRQIPIWIAEYVLAGYGTGAIMAVPCGDQRDFLFAKHFNIPITNIIGENYNGKEANPTKEATLENSEFLNGLLMKDAIGIAINKIEELGIGKRKVNYRMRDAGFSRQRYWGEPFPIIWSDGIAVPLDEKELPLELPFVEKYGPGKEGEGPLSNLTDWVNVSVDNSMLHSDLTPSPSPKGRGEGEESYISSDVSTWNTLKPFARENRKEQTPAEELLWTNLRNRNISNCKFRRQHVIGGFIVDFVCIEKGLVIEVDGDYHLDAEQKKYDQSRTEFLRESGFKEIRFSNDEILKNISPSLEKIREYLKEEHPPLLARGVRGEVKQGKRETSTMPGYAGSSWYFLRYMDPHNKNAFADRRATDYWNQVDVYIGGTEHAVGHLLYSRLWTKFLYDLGLIGFDEPFKKLVNQGMIQGSSRFVYKVAVSVVSNEDSEYAIAFDEINSPLFISKNFVADFEKMKLDEKMGFLKKYVPDWNGIYVFESKEFTLLSDMWTHVNVKLVDGVELDVEKFRNESKFKNSVFIMEDGSISYPKFPYEGKSKYICDSEVEKMSKSKYNTVNPDVLVEKYGTDTFRMYEMFLGPVEQSKPWDTKGIEGVHRFLRKLWRLFYNEEKGKIWTEEKATDADLKVLHKSIKKIEEDTERFSFNTAVSAFMVCVNELSDMKCHKREILEPLLVLITPYAPHIAEELYHSLGNEKSILDAAYPKLENKYLVESEKEYPVSVNGKLRTTITISLDATQDEVEKIVKENTVIQKWLEDNTVKKIIFVKNKMVNIVV